MNQPRRLIKSSYLDPQLTEVIRFINFAVGLENN